MANQEHLNILRQGVEAWNQWRLDHTDIYPDLSDTDLSGSILSEADLHESKMCRTILKNAELTGAKFSGADLTEADLSKAPLFAANFFLHYKLDKGKFAGAEGKPAILRNTNFKHSSLVAANFTHADMEGANLSETRLERTIFNGANLKDADFTGAYTAYTVFTNVDLYSARGLDAINHIGPSQIDIDTIMRSKIEISEVFLREVGIPENFITYSRSLINTPIEYYSCFISYSDKDRAFTERLHADLMSKKVRCWFAPEDLKIGDHYHQRIDESIRLYDKLIIILSEHAVQSVWVEREVVAAREKEDREQRPVLFPIRLDDVVMDTNKAWAADVRRRWHIGDFTNWKNHDAYQQAFERLLRDLKAGKKP